MKDLGLKLAYTLIAAAMVFLLADIVLLAAFDGSLADIASEYYPSPSIAIVQRALASVVFLVAGLMLSSRKQLLKIVDGLMERLERSVAVPGDLCLAAGDRRPMALVAGMLLFLGIIPILFYVGWVRYAPWEWVYATEFYVWTLIHAGWLAVSTLVLAGLVRRRAWAYYTLILASAANILLAGAHALWTMRALSGPHHGGHPVGVAALAFLGHFITLLILTAYLAVCIPLTIYLWRRRKWLAEDVTPGIRFP